MVVDRVKHDYTVDIPDYRYYRPKTFSIEEKRVKDISNKNKGIYITPRIEHNNSSLYIYVGDNKFKLPPELKHIANSIENAKSLLNLVDDWDDEGSSPTDLKTLLKAANFIINYSNYIFNYIDSTIIASPYMEVLRDGSILAVWETEKSSFTIVFNVIESEFTYYYAKRKDGQNPPLKYGIKENKIIDKTTAQWMADNLKYKVEIKYP